MRMIMDLALTNCAPRVAAMLQILMGEDKKHQVRLYVMTKMMMMMMMEDDDDDGGGGGGGG